VLADQSHQLGYESGLFTDRQFRGDPLLGRRDERLLQSRPFELGEVFGDVGQRRAAPELETGLELGPRRAVIAVVERAPPGLDEVFELKQIERRVVDVELVAGSAAPRRPGSFGACVCTYRSVRASMRAGTSPTGVR
jgi:hypothetical protein